VSTTSGSSGTSGSNGANGGSGNSGVSGVSGADGAAGSAGTSGSNGVSGVSGSLNTNLFLFNNAGVYNPYQSMGVVGVTTHSFVNGHYTNWNNTTFSAILGGCYNGAYYGYMGFVGGGSNNGIQGNYNSVAGGFANGHSGGTSNGIGGGRFNQISGFANAIVGGCANCISSTVSRGVVLRSGGVGSSDSVTVANLDKWNNYFSIDHPDPAKCDQYRLIHAAVESPTAGDNIYRFQITTQNCSAVLPLPDYYRFLNEDDYVSVTPADNLGAAYGQMNQEQTQISICSDRDGKFDVLVIGTRKDKKAKMHWEGAETYAKFSEENVNLIPTRLRN
jgi:hypothetical protein